MPEGIAEMHVYICIGVLHKSKIPLEDLLNAIFLIENRNLSAWKVAPIRKWEK